MSRIQSIQNIIRAYGFNGELSSEHLSYLIISPILDSYKNLEVTCHNESISKIYYPNQRRYRFFKSRRPIYSTLLPHLTFAGERIDPVWVDKHGRAVIAWYRDGNCRILLVGLDIEEEIVRHRQGDHFSVNQSKKYYGFDFERPNYLFDSQIIQDYKSQPWADYLGFFLAETFSMASGFPLVELIPGGAKGAIILTGDDDQAYLEKYGTQIKCIKGLPITYFLHYKTNHTSETIKMLPSNTEFGLHPDALDNPTDYDRLCSEQAEFIRRLSEKPIRTVRNHGFLNRGYLGHLKAWEENGLKLDVNYPGVDGTALNGSFLPMKVRRPDGTWSDHYSLLTAFGDGMVFALKMSQRQAARKIRRVAKQIEKNGPGVLVFNFHPQNIDHTRRLHQEVVSLARRPGWIALGMESYLDWIETLDSLRIDYSRNRIVLTSPKEVRGLVLKCPVPGGWKRIEIEPWSGRKEVHID